MNPFGRMRRCVSLFLVGLAVIGTTGCTTITMASDPAKSPPKDGESVVAVSITVNTAQIGAFDLVRVEALNRPGTSNVVASYVLTQAAPGLSRDTALFIGVLPVGEYEFAELTHTATQRHLYIRGAMRTNLGRFSVVQGKAADLGRLVMTPVNTSVVLGRSALVTSNLPMMQRFAPAQARLFEGGLGGGWNGPRSEQDRVEAYAMNRPVGADNPKELDDGSLVAASRLGTVLVRNPDGRWSAARSGSLESLLDVLPVDRPDARLLAAGEFNTLLKLPRGANRFERIDTGDLPSGNLLFIDGNDTAGWYVLQQDGARVTLYHSPRLEGGQWKALRHENVGADFWNGHNLAWIWRSKGGLGYAVSAGAIHWLDYTTGAWTDRQAPNNNRLISIAENPDGSLGILTSPGGGFGGVFATMYTSSDRAQTWQEVKSEFKVKVSAPRRAPSGTLLVTGGVFSDPELHTSTDDGKTWEKAGAFPRQHHLVVLPSGRLLAVSVGALGLFDLQSSKDEGKTWRVDYSNFDRAAYDAAQQKK